MALGITQGELDNYGVECISLLPEETLTYTYKSTSQAAAVVYTITGHLSQYTLREITFDPMLRNARRLRIARTALTVTPTRYDLVTQTGGDTWRVERVEGGAGRPFWLLQLMQVG